MEECCATIYYAVLSALRGGEWVSNFQKKKRYEGVRLNIISDTRGLVTGKKRHECVRFNVISVTSGWVGVHQISRKKPSGNTWMVPMTNTSTTTTINKSYENSRALTGIPPGMCRRSAGERTFVSRPSAEASQPPEHRPQSRGFPRSLPTPPRPPGAIPRPGGGPWRRNRVVASRGCPPTIRSSSLVSQPVPEDHNTIGLEKVLLGPIFKLNENIMWPRLPDEKRRELFQNTIQSEYIFIHFNNIVLFI